MCLRSFSPIFICTPPWWWVVVGAPDGPRTVDAEFDLPIYQLNYWADEHNVLVLMTCHLRKQARDATSNTVRIGDLFGAGSQGCGAWDLEAC